MYNVHVDDVPLPYLWQTTHHDLAISWNRARAEAFILSIKDEQHHSSHDTKTPTNEQSSILSQPKRPKRSHPLFTASCSECTGVGLFALLTKYTNEQK